MQALCALCRRKGEQPAWRLLLLSRDFGAIAVVNAIMFATANGSRSVLMPLLAHQAFGLTPTALGVLSPFLTSLLLSLAVFVLLPALHVQITSFQSYFNRCIMTVTAQPCK